MVILHKIPIIPPHPLTSFEIYKYYEKEARFNGVYSRDNLPKIKDGTCITNLDEHYDTGTHWIALWVLVKYVTSFNHIDKILIILSATSGRVSIISFSTVIGAPAGIASASLTLVFSLTIGIVKKLLRYNKKEKEEAW